MSALQQSEDLRTNEVQYLMAAALSLQEEMNVGRSPDLIRRQSLAKLIFSPMWDKFLDLLTNLYCLRPEDLKKILDLATGSGEAIFTLIRSVYNNKDYGKIIGVDRDSASIEVAKAVALESLLHNIDFLEGDIPKVFEELKAPFNLIMGANAFTHFRDPQEIISKLINLLEEGGIALIFEPNTIKLEKIFKDIPEMEELNKILGLAIKRNKYGIHINTDLMETVEETMKKNGLINIQAIDIDVPMGFVKDSDGILDRSAALMATLHMENFRITQKFVVGVLGNDPDAPTILGEPFTGERYAQLITTCCNKIIQLGHSEMYTTKMFIGQKPFTKKNDDKVIVPKETVSLSPVES